MRSLIGWLGLAIGFCACSSEEGALLVLANPSNASVTRVEVVLASTDDVVPVKQRISTQSTLDEDVRYYKQASTTRAVMLGGKSADGFAILVAPNPDKAKYIPFVFGYAADDSLVAIGRVQQGDDEQTPVPITIPTGELDRFDVVLEPMVVPDPMVGIARNTGTTVTCSRDSVKRGAAWKFAKGIQLRIVFARPGEVSGLDNPADLDCDDHDVESQKDCDDLEIGFHPGQAEVCGQPDYNCDGSYAGTTACTAFQGCPGHTGCANGTGPGLDVCIPDPAVADSDACFCPANQCSTNTQCVLTKTSNGVCAPAYAIVSDICRNGNSSGCMVTVRDPLPANWTVEVAHIDSSSSPTFGPTAIMTADSDQMYLRASTNATSVPTGPIGTVVLEVRTTAGTPMRYFVTLTLDPNPHNECGAATIKGPGGTTAMVDTMSCDI